MESPSVASENVSLQQDPFRIFLSYSHEDTPFLRRVEQLLKKLELKPMSDQRLAYGHGFLDQIKTYIAHAHVFMPLVTPNSNQGQWVHQELGFASALNVPVFPICIGKPPTGLIQTSHSLILTSPDDPELETRLTREAFDTLISWARNSRAYYECAEDLEERALMLANYADQIRSIDQPNVLRQSGGLSSLSLPDEPPDRLVWANSFGIRARPRFSYKCLRKERQALQAHACVAGCKLLLHYDVKLDVGFAGVEGFGPGATRTRLQTLIEFLESIPDDKVRLALVERAPQHSLILVGDWFVAESVTGDIKAGYRNTLFTRHAMTVRHHLLEFDRMFDSHIRHGAGATRTEAIAKLRSELEKCPQPPDTTPSSATESSAHRQE